MLQLRKQVVTKLLAKKSLLADEVGGGGGGGSKGNRSASTVDTLAGAYDLAPLPFTHHHLPVSHSLSPLLRLPLCVISLG